MENVRKTGTGELALEERRFPIQVKQKEKAGRPDIDAFETAMRRAKCGRGFFVSFDYNSDTLTEISRFFRDEHRFIVPLTVADLLEENFAHKLVQGVSVKRRGGGIDCKRDCSRRRLAETTLHQPCTDPLHFPACPSCTWARACA